ncbi:MAG: hypothetical protein ABL949_01755 [Fimbriimonadaceae bacterium]
MKRVTVAGPEHREAIADLIVSSYEASGDFEVVDSSTLRNQCLNPPPASIAFIACDGQRVLSVMHGLLCFSPGQATSALPYIVQPDPEACTPCLTLFRAATIPELRRSALNALLRLHFLRLALNRNMRYMVGTVYLGAQRTRSMEAMGYTFEPCTETGAILGKTKLPTRLAILDLGIQAAKAEAHLLSLVDNLQREYPFHRAFTELRALAPYTPPENVALCRLKNSNEI